MKKLIYRPLLLYFLITSVSFISSARLPIGNTTSDHYLFAYFNSDKKEGQQLCYAISEDGLHFTPLNDGNPIIASDTISLSGGVRDPHILRGEDGIFRLVLTDMDMAKGKWSNRGIIMMSSKNLVDWTHHRVNFPERYSNTHFANVNAVWAPQTIFDSTVNKYMVYFSLHSEKDGPFPKDAVYYAYANDDFSNLEDAPTPLFSYPNPTIDTDIVKDNDGKYHLFFNTWGGKDGLQRRQYVFNDLHNQSEWTLIPGHMQPTNLASEGSTAYQLTDGKWILSYDCFRDHIYQFCISDNLIDFTLAHEIVTGGKFTPKHGSIIRISDEEYRVLTDKYK